MATILAISTLLTPSSSGSIVVGTMSTTLAHHDPIAIVGNAAFNASNGVVSGSGSLIDPYIIEGWEINSSTPDTPGISVWGTTSYFVMRDLWIHSSPDNLAADIWVCRNGAIVNCTIEGDHDGIVIEESWNMTITDNTIARTDVGIYVGQSVNVSVSHNLVYDNTLGIQVEGCNETYLVENTIIQNGLGVSATNTPDGGDLVQIYHNNFINNTEQAHMYAAFVMAPAGDVLWNATYPIGGNYWSDYTGNDTQWGPDQDLAGADGIGDTPHDFPMDWWGEPGYTDQDYYPRMAQVADDWSPGANFTLDPETGDTTTVFVVDASSSVAPRGPISALQVRWDWESDGIWDTDWSPQTSAEHSYPMSGMYNITLEVKNAGNLTNSTVRTAIVEPLAVPEFAPALLALGIMLLALVSVRIGKRRI